MSLSTELTRRLLGAIETDSLVFLCGAGLSIPAPSNLLSALNVSRRCYDGWIHTEPLDAAMRDDIDLLAGHFYRARTFSSVFIRRLVPWNDLVGSPNLGHATVADLLICRAARAALSANVDTLIERWAEEHKVALRGALDGQEAIEFSSDANPLIKFHGCMTREPDKTLWTSEQLADPTIQQRVQSSAQWIGLHLPGKHLVIVGFWTDWAYLNDALSNAFTFQNAASVTIIDTDSTANLERKAPVLWERLRTQSDLFEHVQASGVDALLHLQTAYSRIWARKFYALGQSLLQQAGRNCAVLSPFETLQSSDLYNLRRDAQGVPYSRAATQKAPEQSAAQAAYAHALLLSAGATSHGAWLRHGNTTIRIVNGAGRGLADVRGEYREPPTLEQSDIVLCAGSVHLGVPARVVPSGRGADSIRPEPGQGSQWLTLEQAQAELQL